VTVVKTRISYCQEKVGIFSENAIEDASMIAEKEEEITQNRQETLSTGRVEEEDKHTMQTAVNQNKT